MRRISWLWLSFLFLSVSAFAAEPDLKQLKAELVRAFPEAAGATLRPSPLAGFYEAELDGQVFYVSSDAKFVMLGDLWDLKSRQNLSEQQRGKIALRLLGEIGDKDMIVMGPADAKRTITVFTDVDCPYCLRLHQDVPELNRNGVRVRYLLFPRSGLGGETYRKSVSVWCAADRVKAVGIAKAGGALEAKTCANPVERHYRLGERLGVTGTPTIFVDDGRKLGGYLPAPQMLAVLGVKAAPPSAAAR